MFTWPQLELTDYERLFVRAYKSRVGDKIYPGVLRRTYERTISNDPALIGADNEALRPSANIQIARRSRLFALTFSGAQSNTRLQITNASGTLYTVRDPRTNRDPYVSALIGGSTYMATSRIGGKIDPETINPLFQTGEQIAPLLLEPNWTLMPNETLIFNGNWDDLGDVVPGVNSAVLNITAHVWEFPDMDNADKALREVE